MSIEQKFAPTITNEQTATLPAIRFEGKVQIVDTEQGLIEACNYLSQHSVIGFDTETRPSFKAGITNRVALIQLSTPERCYLFRLCRMKFGRELQRLLENPDIKKVGADVAGDIRSLNQLRHIRAAGFIDLQTIAPQWGIEEKSLRKLSAIVLGKRVSKAQRLSNWEAAQFTEQQISYAATDAWVCLEILAKLEATPKCNPAPEQEIKAQAEPQKIEQKAEQKAKSRRRPFRRRKPHNSKPTTETKE
ncbi:MAG: 3'-5' exonuclease domain-containing protein 2 [Rikenellaceae bacterium]|nr:3'-5' exonuclease domain-containing protein 2 [Rikenellaceae bacterium]MBQ6690814.1 3'-5' exonuclease domain-containing protein 2 [Rikenellaceae bacterium]